MGRVAVAAHVMRPLRRRGLLLALGLALGACGRRADPRADVVLIVLDATRADHLTPYGYAHDTTPHLAALARESVVYRHAIAPGTWTVPSHASLFTGRYPTSHGSTRVPGDGLRATPLDASVPTLAERFAQQGWDTAAFLGNGAYLDPVFGLARGFRVYDTKRAYPAHLLARHVQRWLDDDARWPFLLVLNVLDPHEPYRASPPYDTLFPGKRDGVTRVNATFLATGVLPSPEVLDHCRSQYDGELRYVDDQLGTIFDALRAHGRYDGAWIVVTADHGELFGEHGHLGHGGIPWHPLVHVPLIVKHPYGVRGGTIDDRPVSLVDVAPTLLAALGMPPLDGAQGNDLDVPEPFVAAEEALRDGSTARAIYTNREPVMVTRPRDGAPHADAFDLHADPAQARALPVDPARLAAADAWFAAMPRAPRPAPSPLDPYLERRLRALGYVP